MCFPHWHVYQTRIMLALPHSAQRLWEAPLLAPPHHVAADKALPHKRSSQSTASVQGIRMCRPSSSSASALQHVSKYLQPDLSSCNSHAGAVHLMQVTITAKGAKPLASANPESRLTSFLDHPGHADVLGQDATRYAFTHTRRYIMHSYDVSSGRIITQVGCCYLPLVLACA